MTLYLVDANTLIRAHGDFYPIDRLPGFWEWLFDKAEKGAVKMPSQIYGEVSKSPDLLGQWLRRTEVAEAIVLNEPTSAPHVQRVLDEGYGISLTDVELEEIGKDPFLIAAALAGSDRVVVTRETSKPKALRKNRKVPDVCNFFGIEPITDYELYRRLNFSLK
jgi:hypothetical protein